ncbi:MAG: mechanosensitive ion channel [Methylococcales bacterium]|nr:mechanosensitive ion channel [Methylococcales bacterium]
MKITSFPVVHRVGSIFMPTVLFWWIKKSTHPTLLLLLLLMTQCYSVNVFADSTDLIETVTTPSTTQDITQVSVQAKIDALTNRKDLDEALKSNVLAIYQSTQDELSNITTFNERTIAFKDAIQKAPDLTKKLQKDIEQASEKQPTPDKQEFVKIPLEELTQRLAIEQYKVKHLDEQIKKLEIELANEQNTRPNLIRQEMLNAKQALENVNKTMRDSSPVASDSQLLIDAQQVYLKTQLDANTAKLAMLDAEIVSYTARLGLLKARVQLLGLQKNAFTPVIDTIADVLTDLQQEAEKDRQDSLDQAEKDLSGKHIAIQNVTRENIKYSQQLQAIKSKINQYNEEKVSTDKQINEIDTNFSSAAKKIDLASLSPPLGKILHEQRRTLLNEDNFITQSEAIQAETASTNLEQLVIEDKLKQFVDVDTQLKQIMDASVDKQLSKQERMMIQAELRMVLNDQFDALNQLSVAYNTYLRTLGDFDFARQQKYDKIEKFALYLDERLLWVRSSEIVGSQTITELRRATRWLLSPRNWHSLLNNIAKLPAQNPFLSLFALLNIIVLLLAKRWAKQRLTLIDVKVGKIYSDRFYYTLEALVYTLILVAPMPLIIAYIGWFLSHVVNGGFTFAVGMGLNRIALPWLMFQFYLRLFEPTGIMRQHFQWQENTAALFHKQVAWLRFIMIPCSFIIRVTLNSGMPAYSDSLGRFALNIGVFVMVIFLAKLLNPRHGLTRDTIILYPDGWIAKLRYVYYLAAYAPLVIIGFSIAGYYLSALELQQKAIITLWFVFSMVIFYELALRWLTLANRQLAMKNLQEKRKQTAEQKKPAVIEGAEKPILLEEELIDIPKINAQTITLLNVFFCVLLAAVFWAIWKNILPAFSFLNDIELWHNKIIVNNKEVYHAITLTHLLLAGVYAFITVVAVQNFSGVNELLIFRRLTITAGSRYAVNKITSYTLTTIGFFSVANILGFNWSQVQWLVAALSVGLGFGLQEIFANFVSGIILLFERPIRVGDTVTIGNVTGTVHSIHMRATTLIDSDQKELIVPNKSFITTQLINWTLNDAITRVVIPIGIAYGSDIELAHKVMQEAVCAAPLVLQAPEPSVMLVEFGDSALLFSVRVFVSETINRMPVTHDLHIRLAKALSEHNIEIPFPQRDIHIRSVTPEWCADKGNTIQKNQ